MKIRNGFVANSSSSCAFVLGKYFMTKEQIEVFEKYLKEQKEIEPEDGGFHEDTYILSDKNYFFGEMDTNEDSEKIFNFLSLIKVPKNVIAYEII